MFNKFKRQDIVFLGIVTLVHTIFYLLACHFKKIYMGDSAEYVLEAVNIKDHFFFYSGSPSFPLKAEFMTMRPPLYPLFLALVYFFILNNWVVLILQNLLSIFNIMIVRDALMHIGYKKKYDWLFFLFVVLYPIQFIYTNNIASDTLLQTFAVIYFRQFVLLAMDNKWKHALWMSITLVLGAFVKPIFYPFAIVNFIILLVTALNKKIDIVKVISIALLPLCVFTMYNSWNYVRTGKFHFSSIEAINAQCNSFEYISSKEGAEEGQKYRMAIRQRIDNIPTYSNRYDSSVKIAGRFIKDHLLSYALFHLKHTARILIEPGKAEIDLFRGKLLSIDLGSPDAAHKGFYATLKEKGWGGLRDYFNRNSSMPLVLLILFFNFIRLIGFVIFVFNKLIPVFIRMFVVVMVTYIALAVGPVANTHYFMPVSLIMIGSAMLGFQQVLEKRKQGLK